MPFFASLKASSVLSPQTQNRSVDNEHTRFLEKVLSAVGESIPISPVTPLSGSEEKTLATPRNRFESQFTRRRSSISISDLLISETHHDEFENERSKTEFVFTKDLPRLVPFELLVRNTRNSTVCGKLEDDPETRGIVRLSPLTLDSQAKSDSPPFPLQNKKVETETKKKTTPVTQLSPLVLQTFSSSNCNDEVPNADEKVIFSSIPEKSQRQTKRCRDDDLSIHRSRKKRKRGPKTLKCSEAGCNIWFNQPSAVRNHIRTVHLGERRFLCPEEGCNARFGASGDVTRHVSSVHEGNRNSICNICGLGMSRNTVLYRHIRNIHGQEPNISAVRRAARLRDRVEQRR